MATSLAIGVAATVAKCGLTMVAGGVITEAAQNEGEKEGFESLGDLTGAVAKGLACRGSELEPTDLLVRCGIKVSTR